MRTQRSYGFTLIELMVSITILTILLMIAVPSFKSLLLGNQVKSMANTLDASLILARSEAQKRFAHVVICASSNGTSCTGNLGQGWIVFVDTNKDNTVSAGEAIIQKNAAPSGSFSLTGVNTTYYDSQGAATPTASGGVNNYYGICASADSTICRYICLPRFATPKVVSDNSQCP